MTGPGMPPEYRDFLHALIRACAEQQPTLGLLDGAQPVQWLGADGTRQEVSLGGQHGMLDPETARFVPSDPEPIRLLLAEKLQAVHGDATFPIGHGRTGVDWASVEIVVEGDGEIRAVADRPVDGSRLALVVDAAWQVRVDALVPLADPAATAATELTRSLIDLCQTDPGTAGVLDEFDRAHPAGSPDRQTIMADGVRLALAAYPGENR